MNQPQVYIRPLPPEPRSHLSPFYPFRLSQSTGLSSLCHRANSHWFSILHMVICMFSGYSLNLSHPFLPSLCPQSILYCCLHCYPANRFISTVFLDFKWFFVPESLKTQKLNQQWRSPQSSIPCLQYTLRIPKLYPLITWTLTPSDISYKRNYSVGNCNIL